MIGTAVNNKQQQVTSSFLDMHCSTNICCDLDFCKNVLFAKKKLVLTNLATPPLLATAFLLMMKMVFNNGKT